MDAKPKRRRRRTKTNQSLEAMAKSAMVEAALQARKIAVLQRITGLLEEVKALLVAEGFQVTTFQHTPAQPWTMQIQPGQSLMAPPPPPPPQNPCVECGRVGQWQAPSTRQWFCQFHEVLGKARYAEDRQTTTSPTLRVVQTQATAQRAVMQPPPPPPQTMVETAQAAMPVLEEQPPAAPADALRAEMDRLMNGQG